MEVTKITAYHGTDNKYLHSILNDGFQCKTNDEHWLGNGVYFFIEYELAKWWATNEHKNFGNTITNPIVIESEITYDRDYVIDLRLLEDYNWIYQQYCEFHHYLLENGADKITGKKLRCAFFDWLREEYDVQLTIAGFNKKHSSYLNGKLYNFNIPYIEYQVCVYDNSICSIKGVV